MYRKPDRAPVGAWAAFLHRQRRERDWSQQQAFEALREGLGLGPKSRASYIAIDMGDRQPRPSEVEFLRGYFKGEPTADDERSVVSDDQPALAAAIQAQAAAISALVEELRLSRLEQREWSQGVTEAVARIAGRRGGEPTDDRAPARPAASPR